MGKTDGRYRTEAKRQQNKGRVRTADRINPVKALSGRLFTNLKYLDFGFIAIIILLLSFGLVMLYSTSYYSAQQKFDNDMYYFNHQAVICLMSIGIMLFVACMDYRKYVKLSWLWMAGAYVLMLLVRTPFGEEAYGARRWLKLPGVPSFQPSEVTKIAMILVMAYLLSAMGNKINTRRGFFGIFGIGIVTCAVVYFATDHLSSAIIIFGIIYILVMVVSKKSRKMILAAVFGIVLAVLIVHYLATIMDTSGFFRLRRLLVWVNPEKYSDSGGYQIIQGLYAIGSGGFLGKGLGNSSQKLGYIPESQNDMIISIIGEELGIFGIALLLLMFGLLLYRLLRIARDAVDMQGSIIAMGVFAHIALQVVLNVAVVLNMIPATGITLPFISYGGTAVMFLMAEMGMAIGVSAQSRKAAEKELEQLDELDREQALRMQRQ